MLTLFDYLPSQNAWKVRVLLAHLGTPYRTEYVPIFTGAGQRPEFLAVSPTGAVPAIRLDDGRTLAESNAILTFLATGTPYLPDAPFARAKVVQWLCFEADYVQSSIATLRHWTLTGKRARRPAELVAAKQQASEKVLAVLERALAGGAFLTEAGYTIADIAVFAYVHRAEEAGLDLAPYEALRRWFDRVRTQPGFAGEVFPYSIDPDSGAELP